MGNIFNSFKEQEEKIKTFHTDTSQYQSQYSTQQFSILNEYDIQNLLNQVNENQDIQEYGDNKYYDIFDKSQNISVQDYKNEYNLIQDVSQPIFYLQQKENVVLQEDEDLNQNKQNIILMGNTSNTFEEQEEKIKTYHTDTSKYQSQYSTQPSSILNEYDIQNLLNQVNENQDIYEYGDNKYYDIFDKSQNISDLDNKNENNLIQVESQPILNTQQKENDGLQEDEDFNYNQEDFKNEIGVSLIQSGNSDYNPFDSKNNNYENRINEPLINESQQSINKKRKFQEVFGAENQIFLHLKKNNNFSKNFGLLGRPASSKEEEKIKEIAISFTKLIVHYDNIQPNNNELNEQISEQSVKQSISEIFDQTAADLFVKQSISDIFDQTAADLFQSLLNEREKLKKQQNIPFEQKYVLLGDKYFIDLLKQESKINNNNDKPHNEGINKQDACDFNIQSFLIVYAFQIFFNIKKQKSLNVFKSILKLLKLVYETFQYSYNNITIEQLRPKLIIPKITNQLEENTEDMKILYCHLYDIMLETYNHFNQIKICKNIDDWQYYTDMIKQKKDKIMIDINIENKEFKRGFHNELKNLFNKSLRYTLKLLTKNSNEVKDFTNEQKQQMIKLLQSYKDGDKNVIYLCLNQFKELTKEKYKELRKKYENVEQNIKQGNQVDQTKIKKKESKEKYDSSFKSFILIKQIINEELKNPKLDQFNKIIKQLNEYNKFFRNSLLKYCKFYCKHNKKEYICSIYTCQYLMHILHNIEIIE